MSILKTIASNWFRVDLRTLAIFRFLLGLVCFIDIFRRLRYIEIFYSNYGVAPNFFMSEISSKYSAKAFTFLSSLGTVNEVTVFFYIGLIASFFFMIVGLGAEKKAIMKEIMYLYAGEMRIRVPDWLGLGNTCSNENSYD